MCPPLKQLDWLHRSDVMTTKRRPSPSQVRMNQTKQSKRHIQLNQGRRSPSIKVTARYQMGKNGKNTKEAESEKREKGTTINRTQPFVQCI